MLFWTAYNSMCAAPEAVACSVLLVPAESVLPKVRKVWKQSICYLLKDRGHINELTDDEKKMIVDFLVEN